jgi:hypothetical protein
MRNVSASLRCAATLLIVAGCFAPGAQAGWLDWKTSAPGEKIQFSAPDSSASGAVSNATQNATPASNPMNPGALGLFGQQLFGSLRNSLKSVSSTESVMDLPPPPQAPRPVSKATREAIDRRKNWAFTDLKELDSNSSAEQALGVKEYGPDGREKQPTSAMDRYYNQLGQKPGQPGNQWNSGFDSMGGRNFTGTNQWGATMPALQNGLISSGRDSEGFNRDAPGFKVGGLPDLDSPEAQAEKKYRDDFNSILNPGLPAGNAPGNPTPGLVDLNQNNPLNPKATFNPSADEPHRSVVNPMLGVADPNIAALHSRVFDDPTAASLGLPNPVAAKAPVKPRTAQSVQQMLDPFSASVVKPKF